MITEEQMRERALRNGPKIGPDPSVADIIMSSSSPFDRDQTKLFYSTIEVPLLGAALPTVSAGLGTLLVGGGYYDLATGNYDNAKNKLFGGLALLGASQVGFEMSAMRTATAKANAVQETLEREIFGTTGHRGMFSPALQSESVIATGVMRTQNGRLLTAVTVNNGFRSKIAAELSLLAEKHGAVFVSGTTHAERNLIAFSRYMNFRLPGMPIRASSPVCELCASAGHAEGVIFQNNLRGLRYTTKGWKAFQKGGYIAPSDAALSPNAIDWASKFTLFPGM
jgi:hypothetical protein